MLKKNKAEQEAKDIYNEIDSIEFSNSIQFETGYSDIDVDIPDLAIKKIATTIINRMIFTSIDKKYWNDVKDEINNI